jgi:hypothetical protein
MVDHGPSSYGHPMARDMVNGAPAAGSPARPDRSGERSPDRDGAWNAAVGITQPTFVLDDEVVEYTPRRSVFCRTS